jgi:peptidoglycan/xylan/chitin deacetylase (PgdA/CDA1 family)
MSGQQDKGRLELPDGKRVAVAIGVDFDAFCVWDGTFHMTSPSYLSRGEYGAEVGAPRLLALFEKHGIPTTWCIPGHTVDTFTPICREVKAAGHEIAAHGYSHENPTLVDRDTEKAVMERSLAALERIDVTPRGYRSPAWDFSPSTLSILEELGFQWDSSLMGNDFHPYHPRTWSVDEFVDHGPHKVFAAAAVGSDPSPIVEIPVTWFLDDFPTQEFVAGVSEAMTSTAQVESRWRDTFDYAAAHVEGGVFALTIHPQTSGRPHMIMLLERLIEHMAQAGGAFMTLSEVADRTVFPGDQNGGERGTRDADRLALG